MPQPRDHLDRDGLLRERRARRGSGAPLRRHGRQVPHRPRAARCPLPDLRVPYTGGGYFALVATGGKIDGFEASFEFGGGGAFRFGPLSGQGRLTTGISIRQSGPGAYMDGFFYCGGSARVAFFGVSASLTVRMSLSDGAMAGEAVFEYAFSLGIKDFKFQVPVWRRMENGFGRTTLLVVPTTDHAQLDVSPATGRSRRRSSPCASRSESRRTPCP